MHVRALGQTPVDPECVRNLPCHGATPDLNSNPSAEITTGRREARGFEGEFKAPIERLPTEPQRVRYHSPSLWDRY